jgi:hypothetical protein
MASCPAEESSERHDGDRGGEPAGARCIGLRFYLTAHPCSVAPQRKASAVGRIPGIGYDRDECPTARPVRLSRTERCLVPRNEREDVARVLRADMRFCELPDHLATQRIL